MNPLYQNYASMVQIINWLHQDYHHPSFVHLYENALNFLGFIVKNTQNEKAQTKHNRYITVDISACGNAF